MKVALVLMIVLVVSSVPFINAQDNDDEEPSPIALERFAETTRRPVAMAQSANGRFFVAYQYGLINEIVDGVEGEELLNITSDTPVLAIERGLLGFAIDPNFDENGYFYVLYMAEFELKVILSRFQAHEDPRDTYESQEMLIELEQPYDDHNGGQLAFGPDGYLYIAFGDGGGPEDPFGHAQNLENLYGTIARIDISAGMGYTIPTDNPYALSINNERPEIWLYGFRNPWRFSFDRATDDLFIGDVGNDEYEEVNIFPADGDAGANFGWSEYEGNERRGNVVIANVEYPVYAYPHSEGCAIIGGYMYRGDGIPAIQGMYIYSDYCNRDIWALRNVDGEWISEKILDTTHRIFSLSEDNDGELYVLSDSGMIFKIVAAEE